MDDSKKLLSFNRRPIIHSNKTKAQLGLIRPLTQFSIGYLLVLIGILGSGLAVVVYPFQFEFDVGYVSFLKVGERVDIVLESGSVVVSEVAIRKIEQVFPRTRITIEANLFERIKLSRNSELYAESVVRSAKN